MQKKIFIFIHSAKSGGSSFWHSLSRSISESEAIKDYQITDSFHLAAKSFSNTTWHHQQACIVDIVNNFLSSRESKLIFHYHGLGNELDELFPEHLKPYYILLIRDAKSRLISAYKWFLITYLKSEEAKNEKIRDHFFKIFLSKGYQSILTSIFSLNYASIAFDKKQLNRILPLTLDDYNNYIKSARWTKLSKILNIDKISPIIYEQTTTNSQIIKPILPDANQVTFWENIDNLAIHEDGFNHYLLSNCMI